MVHAGEKTILASYRAVGVGEGRRSELLRRGGEWRKIDKIRVTGNERRPDDDGGADARRAALRD